MAAQSQSIIFGTPEGISEGQWFRSHAELHAAGLHRFSGQGISGTEKTGADSIVLSGGYVDDDDRGDEIVYTGQGGRDRGSGHQVADQSLEERGNAALVVSRALGHPVRVIEGLGVAGNKRRRATKGYVYRGLYRVADHWIAIGQEGFRICQFRLLKLRAGERARPDRVALSGDDDTDLESTVRRYLVQQRLVRDSRVVCEVKTMYDNTCQICRTRLVVSPTGQACSEAAHIQPLGGPNPGPDVISNVLCLCPNCHTLFDRGALQLTDRFDVVSGLTNKFVIQLTLSPEHRVKLEYVRAHRAQWNRRGKTSDVMAERNGHG